MANAAKCPPNVRLVFLILTFSHQYYRPNCVQGYLAKHAENETDPVEVTCVLQANFMYLNKI
jgi:hypothetical protein